MVFSSMTFLFAFLPITLIIYYISPKKIKNIVLAISGLLFYAWGEPVYVLIMIFCIVVDYVAGLLMEKSDSKKFRLTVMIVAVVLNLSTLAVFKYVSFIVGNINSIFNIDIIDPKLALPIGISFYTFQSMSYVIDLYMRNIKVQKSIINFTAYVSLFPQLIAGPIVRYSDVENEINTRTINESKIAEGISIFIRGLGKKVLLANNVGAIWTTIKAMDYAQMPMLTAWVGIIAFTFQIYFDFSGYSDMAIGLGKMLGFEFPENFNHPYTSLSISDFWRRWHITLSSWFKSYVYIPLGGNRCSSAKNIRNLLIVWMLTGLWHGASWNFVFWGLYFGIILILEKFVWGKQLEKLPKVLRWLYSMLLIIFGWVLFEMNSVGKITSFIGAMFGTNGAGLASTESFYFITSNLVLIVACVIGSSKLISKASNNLKTKSEKAYVVTKYTLSILLFVVCLCYLVTSTYNPFLYFNF